MLFFDSKLRRALLLKVLVPVLGAAAVGFLGLLLSKPGEGGPTVSTVSNRQGDTFVHKGDNFVHQGDSFIVTRTEPRPAAPAPAPTKASEAPRRVEVLRRETTTRAASGTPVPPPPAQSEASEPSSPATPPANDDTRAAAAPVTVVRLDGRRMTRPPIEEQFQESVDANATVSLVSATGVAGALPPHGPGAVVEEQDCGEVRDGVYVAPQAPAADLVCTVREEVAGSITSTKYRVPAAP
jgi:hypothetical protein